MSATPRRCSIVVLGDAGVGKTALIWQYIHDAFADSQARTGSCDSYTHLDTVDGRQCLIKLTECGLDDGHATGRRAQIVEADAVVLVYSIYQPASLKALRRCMLEVGQCRERFLVAQSAASSDGASVKARRYYVAVPVFVVGTHAPAVQASSSPLSHKAYSPQTMWRVAEQVTAECVARAGWAVPQELPRRAASATTLPQPAPPLPRNASATYPHMVVSTMGSSIVTLLFRAALRLHIQACRQRMTHFAALASPPQLRTSDSLAKQASDAACRRSTVNGTLSAVTSKTRASLTLPPMCVLYAASPTVAPRQSLPLPATANARGVLPRPQTSLRLPPPPSLHLPSQPQYAHVRPTTAPPGLVASSLARRSTGTAMSGSPAVARGTAVQSRQLLCVPPSRLCMIELPRVTLMPRVDEAAARSTYVLRRSGSLSDLPPPRTSYRDIADDAAAMGALMQGGQKRPQKVRHARCFG